MKNVRVDAAVLLWQPRGFLELHPGDHWSRLLKLRGKQMTWSGPKRL